MPLRRPKSKPSKKNRQGALIAQISLLDDLFGGMATIQTNKDFYAHMEGVYDKGVTKRDELLNELKAMDS